MISLCPSFCTVFCISPFPLQIHVRALSGETVAVRVNASTDLVLAVKRAIVSEALFKGLQASSYLVPSESPLLRELMRMI